MTKLLVIGDLHVKKTNLSEIRVFKDRLSDCLEEYEPENIILLGDILDKHDVLYTVCLNLVNEIVDMCRENSKVFILVGNHDMIGPAEFLNTNHWMNAHKEWENVTIVDTVLYEKISGFKCTFVPYVQNGRFMEALKTLNPEIGDWKKSNIIFAHQEFKGCKMGAIISENGDEWAPEYPQVISGHIHSKQQPQQNIYYTGSALQHAFGESSETTILSIDDDGFEEIDLDLPKRKIIYTTPNEIKNLKFDENCSYKLVVSGNLFEYKSFTKNKLFRELVAKKIKIVFKNTKKEMRDEKEFISSFKDEKTDFQDILYKLLLKEKENNEYIVDDYKNLLI